MLSIFPTIVTVTYFLCFSCFFSHLVLTEIVFWSHEKLFWSPLYIFHHCSINPTSWKSPVFYLNPHLSPVTTSIRPPKNPPSLFNPFPKNPPSLHVLTPPPLKSFGATSILSLKILNHSSQSPPKNPLSLLQSPYSIHPLKNSLSLLQSPHPFSQLPSPQSPSLLHPPPVIWILQL